MKFPLLLAALALFPGAARAADPAPMTPLVRARTATFNARVFYIAANGSGPLRAGQTFSVQTKRPASLHVKDMTDLAATPPGQEIILLPLSQLAADGKTQIDIDSNRRRFIRRRAAPDLTRAVSESGVTDYLALDVLFAADPLRGFTETAFATVNDISVRVFVRRRVVRGVTFERRLFVARDSGLPVRVANFVADRPGHFTEGDRTNFTDWQLDVKFPDGTFNVTPPTGMKPAKSESK